MGNLISSRIEYYTSGHIRSPDLPPQPALPWRLQMLHDVEAPGRNHIVNNRARCHILRISKFAPLETRIWVSYDVVPFRGGFNAYTPLYGKLIVIPYDAWPITRRQIATLQSIRNKNILRFVDFGVFMSIEPTARFKIGKMFEHCPHPSLFNAIHKMHVNFAPHSVLIVSRHILRGLRYLHRKGFSQCNITPHEVLVAPDFSIKIANFRVLKSEPYEWNWWCAPEEKYHLPSIHRTREYEENNRIDIYCFGMIVLEMLAQMHPFSCVNLEYYVMVNVECGKLIPELPIACGDGTPMTLQKSIIWNQLKPCVAFDYNARPTLREISYLVKAMLCVTPKFTIDRAIESDNVEMP